MLCFVYLDIPFYLIIELFRISKKRLPAFTKLVNGRSLSKICVVRKNTEFNKCSPLALSTREYLVLNCLSINYFTLTEKSDENKKKKSFRKNNRKSLFHFSLSNIFFFGNPIVVNSVPLGDHVSCTLGQYLK